MFRRPSKPLRGLTRRELLKTASAATGATIGSGAVMGFPVIWAQNIKDVVLQHAGSPVTAIPAIAEQANKDLGFTIRMQATENTDLLNRFLTASAAIDCADISITFLKYLVGRNVLQAIPVSKVNDWNKTIPLFTKGEYPDGRKVTRQGTAPYSVIYATDASGQKFNDGPSEWLTGVPTVTNGDTLGIRPDLVGRKITSWADLLSPDFKGRAALQEQPTIGVMDTALALEARGEIKYGDKGNMTKAEIDKTVRIMTEFKRGGQFRSFWSTFDQSVNLMASGEVVIQSMISPAVAAVRSRGIPCTFQPLQEGYRGWGITFGVMKHVTGLKLDCFYEYLNWYTSGFEGAFIARQGYYAAQPENARKFLTVAEWDYWYGGLPAATDILSPYGKLMERAGTVRDGGAFWQRLGNIVSWNAVMDEDRYLTRKWNEFVTSQAGIPSMQLGVFIPIGNNGWLISTTSPQYKPSFDLNRIVVQKAEAFGFDFALSMIKFHGFGGPSQFWDYNLESFTLMAGLASVTTRIRLFATCAVLTVPPPVAARMAVTIDSISHGRFGVNIISGWQRREYAQMGIWPGSDHYHRRYDYCGEYVSVMKELWETGHSDFKGDFFQMDDCRCLPTPMAKIQIISAGQSDAGTHYAAQHADYNFCSSGGINTPTMVGPSVARLVAANKDVGGKCGALVLTMIIADETDSAAMAKWEYYKAGTDVEALAWRDAQASDDPSRDPLAGPNKRRTLGTDKLPTQGGVLVGSYASIARMLDELSTVPGVQGVMMTFDDFVIGMEQFGTRILPLMRCRNELAAAA